MVQLNVYLQRNQTPFEKTLQGGDRSLFILWENWKEKVKRLKVKSGSEQSRDVAQDWD